LIGHLQHKHRRANPDLIHTRPDHALGNPLTIDPGTVGTVSVEKNVLPVAEGQDGVFPGY
jgi:hypothetical protein